MRLLSYGYECKGGLDLTSSGFNHIPPNAVVAMNVALI